MIDEQYEWKQANRIVKITTFQSKTHESSKNNYPDKMIKFRYKRKEPTTLGSTPNGESSPTTKTAIKSTEPNSTDTKSDNVAGSLKSSTNDIAHNYSSTIDQSNLVVQAKTCSEQEYMEDCIRAIVVSSLVFFTVCNDLFFCSLK